MVFDERQDGQIVCAGGYLMVFDLEYNTIFYEFKFTSHIASKITCK